MLGHARRHHRPCVPWRVVPRASRAGAGPPHLAELLRDEVVDPRCRTVAPPHDEVRQPACALARIELLDTLDRGHRGRAVGIAELREAQADLLDQGLDVRVAQDPVALPAGAVQADVSLVVGRMGEGGNAGEIDARSSRRDVSSSATRSGRPAATARRARCGTAARSRQIAPALPFASGPPASTRESIPGSRSARDVFTSMPTAEVTITSAPSGSASTIRPIAASTES